MNETTNPEVAPDQLLKSLDTQLATMRSKRRQTNSQSRVGLLVGGLILILAGSGAALLILQQMLLDLPRHSAKEVPSRTVEEVPANNL